MSWLKMFQPQPLPPAERTTEPLTAEVLRSIGPIPSSPLPPLSAVCAECGGYFLPTAMRSVVRVTVFDYRERPQWMAPISNADIVTYCRDCASGTSLEITLQSGHKLEVSDRRAFHIENECFEEIDTLSGEALYAISNDEFDCTHCDTCGNMIEEDYCREHRGTTAIKLPTLHRTPKKSGQ